MRSIFNVNEPSVADVFAEFTAEKRAEGITEKTIQSYTNNIDSSGRCIDLWQPINGLNAQQFRDFIQDCKSRKLSPNTIHSYTVTWHLFLNWCNIKGYTDFNITTYKGRETVPETYTVEELKKLLKKPNMKKCEFAEYRNWVICNLLVNDGCRASSIRNMKVDDVSLDDRIIVLRHMKKKRIISVPLSPELATILAEYLRIRKGKPDDWLFPTETGGYMTEACLASAFKRYNKARGVQRTGIHKFRHTFARLYLIECGGDALKLKRLLGHSTLDQTDKYLRIFSNDLVEEFGKKSPLAAVKRKKIEMSK